MFWRKKLSTLKQKQIDLCVCFDVKNAIYENINFVKGIVFEIDEQMGRPIGRPICEEISLFTSPNTSENYYLPICGYWIMNVPIVIWIKYLPTSWTNFPGDLFMLCLVHYDKSSWEIGSKDLVFIPGYSEPISLPGDLVIMH